MKDKLVLLPNLITIRAKAIEFEKQLSEEFGLSLKVTLDLPVNTYMIDAISKIVSDATEVPMNLLLGESRTQDVKDARHIAMYMCCIYIPGVVLREIGGYFSKDHTTVCNARDQVKKFIDIEDEKIVPKLNECIVALEARIKAQQQ